MAPPLRCVKQQTRKGICCCQHKQHSRIEMKNLNFINPLGRTRDRVIKSLQNDQLPVVIYGSGKFGVAAAELCVKSGIEVLYFLEPDKYYNPGKHKLINGQCIECVNKVYIKKIKNDRFNMLLGIIDYSLLPALREEFSQCNIVEYLDAFEPHIMTMDFLKEKSALLYQMYNELADSESKDVMEAYLYARYTGDVAQISNLNHDPAFLYDWKLLKLCKSDVVIDGGAYVGDTIKEIEQFLGELPLDIYAFEPDEKNISELLRNFEPESLRVIHPIPAGLYSCDAEMRFSNSGTLASSISEAGDLVVAVQAIDSHTAYRNVTVIKMDIEGSEIEALRGAHDLLEEKKPRLAICIYHKNEDIVEIYEYLKQFGYDFYLRQHSFSSEETVLYAV